jgi:nicotinamide mononucleotide transporter
LNQFITSFWEGLTHTSLLEYIAVIAGIVSVWFSQREQVWVYPTGLINTSLFIYICWEGQLFGEASVNLYYTIMSLYGWWLWTRKNEQAETVWKIQFSTQKEWVMQLLFFGVTYGLLFSAISWLQSSFAPDAIPWADALASASAYTGMWLMARKKVESWYWWILTNITSIPLFYIKGYVFTTVQFMVLLLMAVYGWKAWQKKALIQEESKTE